ncbi:hypothetical protein B0H16DRAFT_1720118 [Mycena metata]|uniref:Uncharacterized protein n=1 Tax=Mycena metata TaxID=1033252 RepID=A0AAD7J9G3_9AGAR|nr:hypothetical protein B0H16DRAFT_1720118 [Mycena metata]
MLDLVIPRPPVTRLTVGVAVYPPPAGIGIRAYDLQYAVRYPILDVYPLPLTQPRLRPTTRLVLLHPGRPIPIAQFPATPLRRLPSALDHAMCAVRSSESAPPTCLPNLGTAPSMPRLPRPAPTLRSRMQVQSAFLGTGEDDVYGLRWAGIVCDSKCACAGYVPSRSAPADADADEAGLGGNYRDDSVTRAKADEYEYEGGAAYQRVPAPSLTVPLASDLPRTAAPSTTVTMMLVRTTTNTDNDTNSTPTE